MKTKSYAQILDRVVSEAFPDTVDLTPRILAQIESTRRSPMPHRMRFATTLALVLLAVFALTGAAYAVYRWMGDPGLQAIQDAGLVENVNATAHPTLLPTQTPYHAPQLGKWVGQQQTVEGFTLSLDWIYAEQNLVLFGMTLPDLPVGMTLPAPQLTIAGGTVEYPQGFTQRVSADGRQSVFVSYQILRPDEPNGSMEMIVDVPLVDGETTLGVFHFAIPGVIVSPWQSVTIQQTYAVTHNGIELRMLSARVLLDRTETVVCAPAGATVTQASAQFGSAPEQPFTAAESVENNPGACVRLTFPTGSKGAGTSGLAVRVQALGGQSSVEGRWEFYVTLPYPELLPGLLTPTAPAPVPTPTQALPGAQSIQGITMTLDWIFADAKRVAFGYTITGLPDVPDALYLEGRVEVKDEQGFPVGYGGSAAVLERVPGQPGAVKGTWSTLAQYPFQETEMTFSIDVTLDSNTGEAIAVFPEIETMEAAPPGYSPPKLYEGLVGTFHFDVPTTIQPMRVLEPQQVVDANGIPMRLERVEVTPSYARFALCYNKPSEKDWMTGSTASVEAGGYMSNVYGYSLLYDSDFGVAPKSPDAPTIAEPPAGARCVAIDFLLGTSGVAQSLTLTIPMLEQSVPEVIPDDEIRATQEELKKLGITLDYTTYDSAGGGGGGGPSFTVIPEGMTFQEAYQHYLAALGYLHPGPWVFQIDLSE